MNMFKSKMANRLTISKSLGFLIWLIAFFVIPYIFVDADIYLRLAVLFWYTTFGAIIGIMWIMTVHPVISWFKMPWWFRWIFMWAWLNFVIALFVYHILWDMMVGTIFEWFSPFRLVFEWAIIWFIIDWISTKCWWEGKELCE